MDFGAILCSHKVSKLTIQRSRNAIVESTRHSSPIPAQITRMIWFFFSEYKDPVCYQ